MNTPQRDPGGSLGGLLTQIAAPVARILDRALSGADVTAEEAEVLLRASGRELLATMAVADGLRSEAVGNVVTYVVNRNINFTNV
ncbi:MAG: 7,8-didemethyl-8-hydroxy-5-deazariboflavin synthase subunit CofH, partial [Bacillati bacterium ANGP1]